MGGKFNWGMTWIAMKILGRSLHSRLKGNGAAWLQEVGLPDTTILNRVDFILEAVKDKPVLHIGFSDQPFTAERIKDGTLLHLRIRKQARAVAGLDSDTASVAVYSQLTGDENVCSADICNGYPKMAIDAKPELILLTEVLEHLKDPYKAVDVLHKSFPAGTSILVTVPNYLALDNLAAGLHRTESIHPDHNWHFSPYTLRRLFDERRFQMEAFHFGMYYQPGAAPNVMLRRYPFYGDCIIAVFSIVKTVADA